MFSLKLERCHQIQNILNIAFQNNKKLRHLEISNCDVSHTSLYIIFKTVKSLESINFIAINTFSDTEYEKIERCYNTNCCANLSHLSELKIKNSTFDDKNMVMYDLIGHCSNLTKLEIENSNFVVDLLWIAAMKILKLKQLYLTNVEISNFTQKALIKLGNNLEILSISLPMYELRLCH